MGSYSGNLALATRCDKARVYPSIQTQTAPFQRRGAVPNIASKRAGSETRGTLEKGAIEKVPPNEQERGFYSGYFVIPKRDGGLRPILDLRPINRALGKRPFRMLTLKQILAQIRPGEWFASVDLKDAYFHIQIAPHHRRFLRFAFEGTANQYSVLPFGLALAQRTFSKCIDAALSPLRMSGMRILNYLDDWLILDQSRDKLIRHRLAAYSLGVPRAMCQHAEEHSRPESVHNISGSVLRLRGDESPPLTGRHGISGKAALFIWRNFRGCWDSWRRLQQDAIWDYYTCARCSYGWNLESLGRHGLRDGWASWSTTAASKLWCRGATQISSAGDFPWAR